MDLRSARLMENSAVASTLAITRTEDSVAVLDASMKVVAEVVTLAGAAVTMKMAGAVVAGAG
jgi:hypothetical protein